MADPTADLEQGLALHRQGRIDEAAAIYRSVLARAPQEFNALHLLGVVETQRGNLKDAERLLKKAVSVNPDAAPAHSNLGIALSRAGKADAALAAFDRALAIYPYDNAALSNRGNVLLELDRPQEALACYDRALATQPNFVDAHFNRGNALRRLGRHADAFIAYNRALALDPNNAEVLGNRGNALADLGRNEEALASYEKALALKPNLAGVRDRMANVLLALGRKEEADAVLAASLAELELTLAADPNDLAALTNAGTILTQLTRFEDAAIYYLRAIALAPNDREILLACGGTLLRVGRAFEAVAIGERLTAEFPDDTGAFRLLATGLMAIGADRDAETMLRQALRLDPDDAGTATSLGVLLARGGRHRESLEIFEDLLGVDPESAVANVNRLLRRLALCQWDDLAAMRANALRHLPRSPGTVPLDVVLIADSPMEQRVAIERHVAAEVGSFPVPMHHDRRRDKIGLAYLSADFREHPVAYLAAGLFETHDRSRFEVTAFSTLAGPPTAIRKRLEAGFDRFVHIHDRPDDEVAAEMAKLGIDILIDLTGFTYGNRPALLARRPAPLQLSYLGYPATMGARFIDYILADPTVIPPDQFDAYTERVVHLPNSFQVNDRKRAIAPLSSGRKEAGLPERGFVFAAFSAPYKLTPEFFDVWMRLLREVEGSVLWLASASKEVIENLRREAERRGVAADRLVFAARVPENADHLARLALADLCLDTLPYGAHATTSDALWAGVPVLTCLGKAFAGRVAASLLKAIGVPELVASSLAEYEAIALRLARDRDLLAALTARVRDGRLTSPLFDTERTTRAIESAYSTMWERHLAGLPPESFTVPSQS